MIISPAARYGAASFIPARITPPTVQVSPDFSQRVMSNLPFGLLARIIDWVPPVIQGAHHGYHHVAPCCPDLHGPRLVLGGPGRHSLGRGPGRGPVQPEISDR